MLTPYDVHHSRARRILDQRERTLRAAWSQHPERFVRGTPKPRTLPTEVRINPPTAATTPHNAHQIAIPGVSSALTGSVSALMGSGELKVIR